MYYCRTRAVPTNYPNRSVPLGRGGLGRHREHQDSNELMASTSTYEFGVAWGEQGTALPDAAGT